MFRPFYSLAARMVLVLFLFNSFATSAVALTVSSTGLSVEAGADQEITAGDTLALDGEAYVQGLDGSASSLTEATIDWGDGTSDTATQSFDAFAFYLEGSHLYSTADVYTVTVCATDGVSELTCDSFEINVVAATLPDLTVDSVVYNATDHAFDVTVGNEGTADVDSGATPQLSFFISYVSSALEDSYTGSFDLDTVTDAAYRTMGSTSSFSTSSDFTVDDVTYCTAYIMAVIDPANDIEELNEGDFEANYHRETIDLCPDAELPDLSVTGFDLQRTSDGAILDLTDPSLDLSAEDPLGYSLSATFGNISSVDVDTTTEGFNAEYGDLTEVYTYDWQSFYGSGDFFLPTMSTLEYEAVDILRVSELSAYAELTFCMDTTNTVEESDETNNCYTVDNPFYVAPPEVCVDDGSDDSEAGATVLSGSTTVDGTICVEDEDYYQFTVEEGDNVEISISYSYDLLADYADGNSNLDATISSDILGTTTDDLDETNPVETLVFIVDSSTVYGPGVYYIRIYEWMYEYSNDYTLQLSINTEAVPVIEVVETSTSTSSSVSGGGGTFSTSGSSGSSRGSNNDSDVVLAGSEDVVLTEEEVTACGEMTFVDVATDDPNYDSIYRMWCEGVVHGYDSLHFGTTDFIKRDEVSKIVSRLFGYVTLSHLELPVLTETSYTDVSTDEPLAYYVETLTDEGFYADEEVAGVFNPHEDMSFGEIVDLLDQVTGEEVSLEGYAAEDSMSRGSFASFVFSYFE